VEFLTLGGRLKLIRKECGLSQRLFAEKFGKTLAAYKQYEYDVVAPDEPFVQLLCIKENVNERWLRTGEGEMFKPKLKHRDNLMGYVGQLTDDLDSGTGKHSEFKEWILLKTLKATDTELDALKGLIIDFSNGEIEKLDKKKDED